MSFGVLKMSAFLDHPAHDDDDAVTTSDVHMIITLARRARTAA